MPRLDPYESQVRLNNTVNVTADASSFGGQSARALTNVGREGENTANVINTVEEAKSRMRAAASMTNADLNWREKMIAMQNDPEFTEKYGVDGSGFADAFKDEFETFAREQIATSSNRDRKYVEQGMYNLGESLMGSAMEYQAQVGAAFASDTLTKTIDNAAISAKLSPNQFTSIMANATLAVNSAAHIDPTTRRRFNETAAQNVTTGAVLGLLEKNGVAAANAIKKGTMSFTMLDEQGNPVQKKLSELVSASTFETLSNQADTVIKKAESEQQQVYADIKSDIDTMIEMAETPDDFMAINEAIVNNQGIFKHKEMNELRVKMFKKSKDIRDDYDSMDRGNAFSTGNAYLNPADNEAMKDYNNYYNKRVAPVLPDMEPMERNTYLANMVATTKVMPDNLKGDIRVAARSNNPDLIASTVDFIDRLRNANPHVIQDIDAKDLARLDMINNKMASGLQASEAIKQVDDALDVNNSAVYDKRVAELKDLKIDYRKKALSNFNAPWYVKMLPGDSGSVQDLESNFATRQIAQIENDYRQAYDTQYKLSGNTDAAEKYANQVVGGTYGVTEINGTKQVMRNPPDKYFGMDNVDPVWMREQMLEEARNVLNNSWVEPGTTADKDIMLVPVPFVTPRSAKEGRPLYKLMLNRPEGLVDVLGNNKYFTFDKAAQIKKIVDQQRIDENRSAFDIITDPPPKRKALNKKIADDKKRRGQ